MGGALGGVLDSVNCRIEDFSSNQRVPLERVAVC